MYNSFCDVSGKYTLPRHVSLCVKGAYEAYYQVPLGDQEKNWAAHVVCHKCEKMIQNWTKGKQKGLPFDVPMVWREPKDYLNDCYFCILTQKRSERKST